jgi:hypothetical protein
MEDTINLDELYAFYKALGERDHKLMEFYAAFKGVDLNTHKKEAEDRLEAVKKRAEARLRGSTNAEIESNELKDFGLDFEVM